MLMRKVHARQLMSVSLTSADYFVLDMMVQNMEDRQKEQVGSWRRWSRSRSRIRCINKCVWLQEAMIRYLKQTAPQV